MADNILDVPLMNPIRFYRETDPEYPSFDLSPWLDIIPDEDKPITYNQDTLVYTQKWFNNGTKYDPIVLQIPATFGPATIDLLSCTGAVLASYSPSSPANPAILPGWVLYQWEIEPPQGLRRYYWRLNVGVPGSDPETDPGTIERLVSDPQETINYERNTLLWRYKNSYNTLNIVFGTGIEFFYRCEGRIGRIVPKQKISAWEDQPLNYETNRGKPYREWPVLIGQKAGVSDKVPDTVNYITSCDHVLINGVQYTRPENGEITPTVIPGWPTAVWELMMRQTKNRNSTRVQNGNSPSEFFFVTYNIETKLFGPLNAPPSANPVTIVGIE